jgi:hypothetical protein
MTLVLHPTSTAQWHSLVCEAEAEVDFTLDEELQSYLVFLLMRFLSKPELASKILAIDYVEGMLAEGNHQHNLLRDVADSCLLYSGFFPHQAKRKQVSEDYFSELGSGAYHVLSYGVNYGLGSIFSRLSETFIPVSLVLDAIRKMGTSSLDNSIDSAFTNWASEMTRHGPMSKKIIN